MSDTDDMPELVDSSEEEENPKMATNLDYVDAWLTSRKKHLGEHHHCIKKCAYGPLLFGFSNNVPKMWITAMHDSKLLVTKNREKDVTPLTKEEWELTDMFTEIFNHANPRMKSREQLKSALDAVDEIEKQAIISNGNIDVKQAIEKALDYKAFHGLWSSISGKTKIKKNSKAAQFCLLYILKNFHYHVLGYGRDGKLIENEIKSLWTSNKNLDDAEQNKEKGNKAFKENKFDNAVRWYTQAIKKDPLSHIYYGNRSQAYLKLKKFREALCDGLRAVTLDHDWPKGYYRYAEAYFELGMLDKAREVNHMGRQACVRCQDNLNLRQIDEQRDKFKTEKARLEQIEKNIWSHRGPPDLVSDSNDSDEEGDGAAELISDSDDNFPPVKSTKLRRKQQNRKIVLIPFNQSLREGSDALVKNLPKVAVSSYQKALDCYASSTFLQRDLEESEYVVLKYSFGISCVATCNYRNIMDAIDMFQEINSGHANVKFPASYYGLGKAYVTLNRFSEARKRVTSGLSVVKNGLKCNHYCWPGTDKVIPESKKDKLEGLLKDLLEICKYPPTPDAVCRHRGCLEGDKDVIYFSDPDFKGFVRVNCHSMCVVEFHPSCWKSFKSTTTEKQSDKEQLDQSCPTPDCTSCIQRICIYRHDGVEPRVLVSEKSFPKSGKAQKKSQKLEPSSQDKISRKAEKKAIRKQKRQEARDKQALDKEEEKTQIEEETSGASSLARQVLRDETELEALTKAETTKLDKKEETDDAALYKGKQKPAKQKKKKEKTKQVLNVEVNFTDRRENQLLGEHSVLSDGDEEAKKGKIAVDAKNPFSVSPSLQSQIHEFDSVYDHSINPQNNKHNEVANNLFVYFAELLGEHGPLHVNDTVLTKELEDFPPEAREVIDTYGGLKGFLQQSLKFGLIDNFVCLLKDAVKAKKLALAYKSDYPHLQSKPFSAAVQGDIKPKPKTVYSEMDNVIKKPLNPTAQEFTPQPSHFGCVGQCASVGPFIKNSVSACETALEIDRLVKSAGKFPKIKQSDYNALDDFDILPGSGGRNMETSEKTYLGIMDDILPGSGGRNMETSEKTYLGIMDDILPGSGGRNMETSEKTYLGIMDDILPGSGGRNMETSEKTYLGIMDDILPAPCDRNMETSEKTYLGNMDDIDDIQLCDDDLETETTGSFGKADWGGEHWDHDLDDVSDSISLTRNCSSIPKSFESVRSLSSIKSDELDPSRCSSRSSHSELGDIELGYRTGSPAIQGFKSAYSKISQPKETSKDIFTVSSCSTKPDVFNGDSDYSDGLIKKSGDQTIIPPHPFMVSSKDSFGSFDSHPSSCGSPLASAVGCAGDGTSVSSIWAPASTTSFTSSSIFTPTQESLFTSFQERLTNKAQQSTLTSFSGLTTTIPPPISPPVSSVWSTSNDLDNNPSESSFQSANTSYSLFGGLNTAHPSGFTQKSDWLNVKQTQDVEVQTGVVCVTVGTSTDLDLTSLLLHYKTMQEQHAQTMTTIQKAEKDKLTLTTVVKQCQLDKMKAEQKQEMLVQQITQLQKQVQTLQRRKLSLEENLQEKDITMEEYRKKQAESSEQCKREVNETILSLTELQSKYRLQEERAISAECEYLQLKMQVTLQPYTGAKREATFHQHHVSSFVRKCQEDQKDVPTKTKPILAHLANVIETCDSRIADVKRQYESNVKKLKEGVPLGELPPLSVASPPIPMPPEIASMMSQIFGSSSVTSPRMPMRLSPIESSPKPLQALPPSTTAASLAPISHTKPTNGAVNGNLSQPKPLQPLGVSALALAKSPRLPMTTAQIQAGLQNGSASLSSPTATSSGKSSFEKLISAVKNILPKYERSEVIQLVHQLRESRGGSLSGLGLEEILKSITEMVRRNEVMSSFESTISQSFPPPPPPGLSSSWAFSNTRVGMSRPSDVYLEEENPCAICHDELEVQESRSLDCGHKFHTECIRTWFKEQSTCPNCRVHALLNDDFPSLK